MAEGDRVALAKLARISEPPLSVGRTSVRYRLLLDATASGENIVVHNISRTGLLIEGGDLELGSRVAIALLGSIEVEGHVQWRGDQFTGVQFSAEISAATVAGALRASPVIWPRFGSSEHFQSPARSVEDEIDHTTVAHPRQLPIHRRVQIIVLISMLLWGLIALALGVAG